MRAENRPGGWVDGIGWVALIHHLDPDDRAHYCAEDQPEGDESDYDVATLLRWYELGVPVIVTRWADGTEPTR